MTITKKLFVIVGFLGLSGVVFSESANVQAEPPQGIFKEAVHTSISADWLDPSTTSYSGPAYIPLYLFYDAWLKPMPGNLYGPSLAESWSISADSKVYEFKLRKGVRFHNGDPMTADDVVFSFWRYKGSQAKTIHEKTNNVEAVSPNLVRISFKEAFPDFLDYLLPGATQIAWVVPKKYLEKVGDAGFKKRPIGCGPYKFVEFVPGVKLIGEAFEEYWRKVPHIKRMEFIIIPEPATRLAMVKRGEVDVATLMNGVFYEEVKKDTKLKLFVPESPANWLICMAAQWDPNSPWSDARIRKAASLAIDRQTLADIHMPGCGPIGSIALKGDPMGLELSADPYAPEQAKKLLADAGYPKGFQGGKFYPFEGGFWPYGEQIANYWKAVGITVDTVLLDRPAWLAARVGGKMKGAIFYEGAIGPTIGGRLSYLLGAGSYGNYPDIQSLWDRYEREAILKVRKDLITQIQKLIYERTMYIPLTNANVPTAVGPRIKGDPFKLPPLLWFSVPFEDIELKK